MPARIAAFGEPPGSGFPFITISPPTGRSTPKMACATSRPSRAHQPRESHDLPAPQAKRDALLRIPLRAQVAHLDARLAALAGGGLAVEQIAADHQLHHLVVPDLLALQSAGVLPIAQGDDAVGDLLYLAEPVGNIDDADPLGRADPCMIFSSVSVSLRVRLDVGSSMSRMRVFIESALAISTICW